MNVAQVSTEAVSDIEGAGYSSRLFPHSPKVSNILSESWVSIYIPKYYADIIILCS